VVRRGPIRERDQVSGGLLLRSDRRLPARADRANDIPGDRPSLRVWRSLGGALESARELLKLGTRALPLPECRVDGVRDGRAGHTVGVGSLRGPLELTADMGLAELRLKYVRPRLALLEVGEDRVSEIAKEEHVSLAQPRPLLVCQAAEHVEAGVETG
jgi:hypothetical protein